ncbi:MAG: glycoside hydrolase family 88/105 protein, partial [Acidobacteriota bacterium]
TPAQRRPFEGGLKEIDSCKKWPVRIADSFIDRHPASDIYDSVYNGKWSYGQGVFLEGLQQLYKATRDRKYLIYLKSNIDMFIGGDGSIRNYNYNDFNIDNITTGRQLLFLYSVTKDKKYKIASDTLFKQLKNQRGLEGLFMVEPFCAQYSKIFRKYKNFDYVARQFILAEEKTRDNKNGLLYPAWNESFKGKWTDIGRSQNYLAHSMGCYAMALIDVLDYFPKNHPKRRELIRILRHLSESLIKIRDEKSSLWNQVLNQGTGKGNSFEASANCILGYALAKGSNKGYLDKKYLSFAKETFYWSIRNLVAIEGKIDLYPDCLTAELGSFILLTVELEKANMLESDKFSKNGSRGNNPAEGLNKKVVALDYYFNHELKKDSSGKYYQYHYTWEDKLNTGFSVLGSVFKTAGAGLHEIIKAPGKKDLDSVNIYIIVDPDTPKETLKPNYIEDSSIAVIENWVKKGGVLILMGNDKGNAEFQHLNNLSEKFGIHFNEDCRNRVSGDDFKTGKFDKFPDHPLFKNVKSIFLKELSTFRLKAPAVALFTEGADIIMAASNYGKGFVFAVGDPWLYNEYIDNRRLPEEYENYKASENLARWLLGKSAGIKSSQKAKLSN